MPIYEYVCNDCQTRYERIVMSSCQEIACPKCESKRHTLQLSVFSAAKSANGPPPRVSPLCPAAAVARRIPVGASRTGL